MCHCPPADADEDDLVRLSFFLSACKTLIMCLIALRHFLAKSLISVCRARDAAVSNRADGKPLHSALQVSPTRGKGWAGRGSEGKGGGFILVG